MYYNNEETTGIEALNEARVKTGRVNNNVKYISNKGIRVKRKVDKFVTDKALNEHSILTNKHTSNVKSNAKAISKSVGKNITQGTIRINGRIVESLYNKNDVTNSGINAMSATGIKTRRTVETSKEIIDKTKTGYKVSKKAANVAKELSKKVTTFLTKFIISNPFVAIFILIFIIMIASSSNLSEDDDMIALFAGLSTDVIVTDEDTIDKYKELLLELDADFNNNLDESYTSSETVEVNGYAETSFKEILSLLAAMKEQEFDFDNENSNSFKLIHSKMYEINTVTSTYYCDDEKCKIKHKKIVVDVISHSFDEMLDILQLTEEEKELARRFIEKDYSEIYSNFE